MAPSNSPAALTLLGGAAGLAAYYRPCAFAAGRAPSAVAHQQSLQQPNPANTAETGNGEGWGSAAAAGVVAMAGLGVACRSATRQRRAAAVVQCRAQSENGEAFQKVVNGAAAAALALGVAADSASAYPIFAQQNYKEPEEATGKIVCANCHLAQKDIDVRMPQQVLPDTIFKTTIEIPAKYEKRMQPIATGEKAPMNVGAVAIMPKGWKLAPKNRLPKPLKKEMKGLAWAPFSKEVPNAVVAGPVPGSTFKKMVLPILSPDPNSDKDIYFDRYTFAFGGNRGRGQVYPEGNLSNNNQYFAGADGKVTAIDGMKVTVTKEDGSTDVVECGAGADIVVDVGEVVSKGEPITTNPNVGGFGQDEKEMTLQDMNRVYAYCALATSIFVSQLTFVLKKKQFEKVQLAEGF